MLPLMLGQRELFIMFFPQRRDSLALLLSSTVRARNNTVADIWMSWASPALLPTSVSLSHPYKTSTASKHRTCSTSAWSPNLLRAGVSATVSLLGLGCFFFPFLLSSFLFLHLPPKQSPSQPTFDLTTWIYFLSTCVGGFYPSQAFESSEADKIPIKRPITGMDRCAVTCWNAGNCRNYIAKSLNKLSTLGETADQAWINHSLFSSKNLSQHCQPNVQSWNPVLPWRLHCILFFLRESKLLSLLFKCNNTV